jgi:hypothetical protein
MNNTYIETNYYESEYYKIKLYENNYSDKFIIDFDDISKITIKRIDKSSGWGQHLKLLFRNKIFSEEKIIDIGNSEENIKIINIEFRKIEHYHKNHFEDDNLKIFYISKEYNDIFKIDYDEIKNIINIKRIDSNEGWGQILKLKYINKKNLNENIIHIGSSKINSISINININKLHYPILNNYYESDFYKITIIDNIYNDTFLINFYDDNNTIYIKRIDNNEGWGQYLKVNIFDKNKNYNYNIYIGNSINNELYKVLDLTIRKVYASLTTIPSRIKLPNFINNVNDFLKHNSQYIEQFFIVIPKKYKRFTEEIPNSIIEQLKNIDKITIINIDDDFGPASKYLGPLMNCYNQLENNILVIIDDDRTYNKNLVKNMITGYNSFPDIKFLSGLWKEYFNRNYRNLDDNFLEIHIYQEKNNNKFIHGNGLGGFFGFAIKVKNIQDFINYNLTVLNRINKSFFHDEGIILGYLKYKEEKILYLKHKGCNLINEEMVDALCTSNLVDRGKVEKEILMITNLEKLL